MTYFEDLSKYTYCATIPNRHGIVLWGAKNVGWLDAPHEFPQGEVPEDIITYLAEMVRNGEIDNKCRGHHSCTYCGGEWQMYWQFRDFEFIANGELHIKYKNTLYIAPTMIIHYIDHHHYRPPDIFIEAVRARMAKKHN